MKLILLFHFAVRGGSNGGKPRLPVCTALQGTGVTVTDDVVPSSLILPTSGLQLLVSGNFVPSSLILSTQIMEAIRSSEISDLTRATRYHIPQEGILQNLKSYIGVRNLVIKQIHHD
jgi:hypothetical protein